MPDLVNVLVPDIGDFTDVPVIEVLVGVGGEVEAEQSLVTLESDKATMEVPAPVAGIIRELRVCLDDSVSEGDLVAIIEPSDVTASGQADPVIELTQTESTDGTASAALVEPATEYRQPQPQPQPVHAGVGITSPGKVPYASPAIRRFARELGVDLTRVSGSGRGGRILREDVSTFVKTVMSGGSPATSGGLGFELPPAPNVDFSRYGTVELQPLTRIQKISGAYLHRNWVSIPHVTQHDLADITAMEAYRKANAGAAKEQGFKLTPVVFLILACVAALKKFPQFNASLDETRENLVLKKYFNIGIAVDTPQGLVVPVIRDCDNKDILQLAQELAEISQTARDGKLKPTDMQGGCFSISSLGGIGGTAFTPIINAPEVAVLGVSRASMSPQWDGESFRPRLRLPLSLSYDHRVIDGASAARFTRYLATYLEDFQGPDG